MKHLIFSTLCILMAWRSAAQVATPELVLPFDGDVVEAQTVYFLWGAVPDADTYLYRIDTTSEFSSPMLQEGSTPYVGMILSDYPVFGQFFWQMAAVSGSDTSAWSEVRTFDIGVVPQAISPSNNSTTSSVLLMLSCYNVGGFGYRFQVSENPSMEGDFVVDSTINTTQLFLLFKFGTTYYWRISIVSDGQNIAWSEVMNFSTIAKPTLTSPNGASWDLNPLLSCEYIGGANNYQYQLDTIGLTDTSPILTSYQPSKSISGVQLNDVYNYRIRATSSIDTSDWSDVRQFWLSDSVFLLAPYHNEVTHDLTPFLNWGALNGATHYYQLDTVPTFTSGPIVSTGLATQVTTSQLRKTTYYWRVRFSLGLDTIPWSPTWSFSIDPKPLTAEPVNNAVNYAVNPKLRIDYSNAGTGWSRQFMFDTVPEFNSSAAATYSTGLLSYQLSFLKFGQTYYFKARQHLGQDTSSWSDVAQFTTAIKPKIVFPSSNILTDPAFNLSIESLKGATSMVLQIDTSATFNTGAFQQLTSGSQTVALNGLQLNQHYYARAMLMHPLDTSEWSDVAEFNVKDGVPQLYIPANNALTNSNVTFNWYNSPGVTGFIFQCDTSEAFNSPAFFEATGTGTTFYAENFYLGTKYHWRVANLFPFDTSSWSVVRTFTVKSGVPILLAPADQEALGGYTTVFTWSSNNLQNTGFLIQFDTDPSFNSEGLLQYTAQSYPLTFTPPSAFPANATIYWRMAMLITGDTSDWSGAYSFTTPSALQLEFPANGTNLTSVQVHFAWLSYFEASEYLLKLDTVSDLSSPAATLNNIGNTSPSLLVNNLPYGQHYYWQVLPVMTSVQGEWSPIWAFETPSAVSLLQPDNGSFLFGNMPTTLWSTIEGSTGYHYQYDVTPDFNTEYLTNGFTTNVWATFAPIAAEASYFWRVRAYHDTDTSDWSETRNFFVALTLTPEAHSKVGQIAQANLPYVPLTSSFGNPIEADILKTFPNPATDVLHIAFREDVGSDGTLQLCSLDGRCLIQQPADATSLTLDISNLPVGNYLVLLKTLDGRVLATEICRKE